MIIYCNKGYMNGVSLSLTVLGYHPHPSYDGARWYGACVRRWGRMAWALWHGIRLLHGLLARESWVHLTVDLTITRLQSDQLGHAGQRDDSRPRWDGARFHPASQNKAQLKTYESFISRKVKLQIRGTTVPLWWFRGWKWKVKHFGLVTFLRAIDADPKPHLLAIRTDPRFPQSQEE